MNETSKYRFTIISPIFNEEGNVHRLAEELGKFMEISKEPSVCILFVNDGSADNSLQLIRDECSKRRNFYYKYV